ATSWGPYLALLPVGFAVPACCQARGALLPHHFTLATRPCGPFGGIFLLHFPSARAAQALPGTVPCGARTFLGILANDATAWPTPPGPLSHVAPPGGGELSRPGYRPRHPRDADEVAAAGAAAGAGAVDPDLRGPSGAAEAADKTPQGRRAWMRGVFRGGFDASSENPAGSADPVRSTGRAGRGVLSLRRVSLHKQRKVARAVTARKLLDLPWLLPLPSKERSRTARCARPSSALRAPSPASGRRVEAVPGA